MREIRKDEQNTKMKAILTPEQYTKYQEMNQRRQEGRQESRKEVGIVSFAIPFTTGTVSGRPCFLYPTTSGTGLPAA